jgi:5'-nucleotidase
MRPLILITNDDGVLSPGLAAVAEAVAPLGELLIAAPRWQQTTMGRAFPRTEGTGVIERMTLRIGGADQVAYGVAGSPAQAVAHGVLELAGRLPDLCISGINYGENLGQAMTCSGTLGAAFEAFTHGIPAIAASLQAPFDLWHLGELPELDWAASQRVIALLAAQVLREGLPPQVSVLNLNVPGTAGPDTPIRLTRQSRLSSSGFARPGRRPLETPWQLTWEQKPDLAGTAEPGSDIHAFFVERAISITPLSWDMSANAGWAFRPDPGAGISWPKSADMI